MNRIRLVLLALGIIGLVACSDDVPEQKASVSTPQATTTSEPGPTTPQPLPAPVIAGTGGATVQIIPENPTSTGCLRTSTQGVHGRSALTWKVNGVIVTESTGTQLCSSSYKRHDIVTVELSTKDKVVMASVEIGNSPPRVVELSSTPAEIFAGTDITVMPVAEDADDDRIDFKYQWLINGQADPLLVEATLPGDRFTKGDSVQVLIVPNDFYDDGPMYEGRVQSIPNAGPQITSQPPQGISSLDYRYQIEVSDPDDDVFTYRLDEAPAGMSIDKDSGLIQWSLVDVTPGDYTVAIAVTDPEGAEASQKYTLTLGVSQ